MKKKILSLLVTMGLAASLAPVSVFATGSEVWDGSVAESFAGGKGTKDDPYQIATGSQLAYLGESMKSGTDGEKYQDTYFELTEDIDLGGKEWTPIGYTAADLIMGGHEYFVFSGSFDGNGHTIKNLTIGTETSPYSGDVCGLFGATGGTIEDVVLENVSINYVGGKHRSGDGFRMGGALVGYSMGDIVNCTVTGLDFKAGSEGGYVALNSVGGLVGVQDNETTISNSRVSGKIEETTKKGIVGGLVGTLVSGSSAKYCGADVSVEVTGNGRGIVVGGFVGKGNGKTVSSTLIEECYATGDISGADYAGGFVGSLWGLNINNCYATGNVSKSSAGASFMGTDASEYGYYGSIKNCYATGLVSDISSFAYAFAMQDTMKRSTIQNCYYNAKNTAVAAETSTPLTVDNMKDKDFVDSLNGSSSVWIKRDKNTPACGAEPADYSKVNEALDGVPADLSNYTDESVENLNNAVNSVRKYRNLAQQSDVDKMAKDINDAVAALVYKDADYTEVDKAEKAAKALNKDDYKDFSAVEKALAAIDRTKNITEQADVDAMAKDINDAVAALVYKDADYTELDKAEKAAKALNKDDYKDFSAVEKALAAIDRTKNITEQADVDAMAKDINDAVAALVYKDADYTELDKAEKAAKALNKDDYKDFSAVEKALAAIDRTKNITEQADVDAMAKAINDAVAGLEKKETPAPTPSKPDNTTSSEGSSSAPENNSGDKSSSNTDISTSSADSSSTDSSKTDNAANSSSKAASNASTTNPSTGVAGGACALALLSGAAVVMAKRKK